MAFGLSPLSTLRVWWRVAGICGALVVTVLGADAPAGVAPPARVIRVGVLTDNDPFSFLGPDGKPQGFAVDLLAELEATMGLRLERVVGPTNEINAAFEAGRLDLLQSYARTAEREQWCAFSGPYYKMAGSIFVRRGAKGISKLADLRGRRVVVHRASLGQELLRGAGLADSIVPADSLEDAFRRVENGEADATLAGRLTGLVAVRRLNLRQVVVVGDPVPGYDVEYCFAVPKADTALLNQIQEGLDTVHRANQKRYDEIYQKWLVAYDPESFTREQFLTAIAGGLLISLVIALWALRRQRLLRVRLAAQAEALRASEERFRGVFESSLGGLLLLDGIPAAGVPTEIVEANPTSGRLLGAGDALVPGVRWEVVLPRDGALLAAVAAALAPGGTAEFEHARAGPPGAAWLRVSVNRAGSHVLVGLADLTALKATEEQLRRTQKLEAIGTLSAGIAHDFNNILTSILGNAELARLETDDRHPARESLDEILRGSDRARILVRQILSFSREVESAREVVKLAPLVQETLRFIRAAAPSTIELRYSPPVETATVLADATQLHQVLMNLCTNAVHAMNGDNGKLEITEEHFVLVPTEAARHPPLAPGRYVRLIVRDTGCGMPPEVLERIFEPFFTTKKTGEGTGLGLAVVHGIVRAHAGTIEVESRVGVGTTFTVYLPLTVAAPAENAGAPPAAPVPAGDGEHVLFIDDEPAIAQMARVALTRLGYEVTAYCEPREALSEFERAGERFDLVFTDLTMPNLNGFEVAARVQQLRPECPVVLASGFLSEHDFEHARRLKLARLIDKPLSYAKLGVAVADGLRRAARGDGERPLTR